MRRGASADVLTRTATAMAAVMRHRGPDAQTTYVDAEAGLALAQARLAIIDLSPAGALPMTSANGRFVIAYNGEVYETAPLRAELERHGIHFHGHSDTEVILESCAMFGVAATLPRLIGMFAFALWDKQERRLTLVRDRFGIKPLYYARTDDAFVWGSELKALLAWPGLRPSIDRDALASYFRFTYVPAPASIFQGVRKLPPGHFMTIGPEGASEPQSWWSLRPFVTGGLAAPSAMSIEEAEDELDRLLRLAVGSRMVADVPLGAFLSGGIDSSTVVAQMQAQSPRPVKTFTIGFTEPAFDESKNAEAVARHLGTDHTTLMATPAEAMAVIPGLPEWYDEPFADSSQIPTYLVSRLARTQVTVSLSGDGGDELFAGYTRYAWGDRLWRILGPTPAGLRRLFARALDHTPSRLWTMLEGLPGLPRQLSIKAGKLAEIARLSDSSEVYRRLISIWPDPGRLVAGSAGAWGSLSDREIETAIAPLVERMQYLDAVTYLPDDILTKVDRASMAVSLEARVPLLDHRVAAFAFGLPSRMRFDGTTGKIVLRRVLARYVPRHLFERPKTGFGIPIGEWLRGPLRDWAEDLLRPAALADSGLTPEPVRRMWSEHLERGVNRETEIWTVLMYQAWFARWNGRAG
jgi:asparagine synthase (glutamine-hydrolysing)